MMQAIWSRTAQTRSCRCRSCFHAATSVARRATTATSRRRLKVSDVFTACYSTILATAAVADAKVKEDRRKEWDRAIAEAKEPTSWADLGADKELGEETEASRIGDKDQSEFKTYSPWKDADSRYTGTSNFETRLKALDQEIRESTQELNVNNLGSRAVHDAENLQEASEVEWIDEEPDEILPERDPKNPLHLERRELSCASLVEQLLARLVGSVQRRTQNAPDQKPHPELKDMVVRIQHLRDGSKKLPTYKWEDLAVIDRERRALHRSLLDICDGAKTDDIPSLELMLAKICYNLLVSQSPVSMVTYNILIQALGRLKQYELAQVIVDSFLYETKFKPNRNSIRIILEHYHQKNDPEGWRAIKNRMRATEGDMRIKRRWHEDLDILPIQDWIYRTNPRDLKFQKGNHTRFLTQKPPRDSDIFDALIRTSLTFNGPRNAIMHIKRALQDCHQIYSDTICAVMEELLKRRDGRGSTSLINQILTLWDESADPSAITFTDAVRRLIYQLLDMIGVDTTLGSQLTPPNKLPLVKVQAMLRQLKIFSIEDAIGRTEDFMVTIEDHLGHLRSSQGRSTAGGNLSHVLKPTNHLEPVQKCRVLPEELNCLQDSETINLNPSKDAGSVAAAESNEIETRPLKELDSLEWFATVERARANDLAWNTASGRWNRLEFLDAQLDYHVRKLEGLQAQLLPLALQAMPRYQQLRYLDITSSNMVYHKKEDRPNQYQELLRVRREGATGHISFIEKQLDFRWTVVKKIRAEVFSMKTIALNRLRRRDREFYLEQSAKSLMIGEKRAVSLASRISELFESQQILISQGQASNFEDISRRLQTLEGQACELEIYNNNLRQTWENMYASLQQDCLYKAEKMIKSNARLLGKYEDHIFSLSPYALKWTLPRATRMVRLSERKVHDLAAEVNAVCPRWLVKKNISLVDGRKRRIQSSAIQVDGLSRSMQVHHSQGLPQQALQETGNLGIEEMSNTAVVEATESSTRDSSSLQRNKGIERSRNVSLRPSALDLAPVLVVEGRTVTVAAAAG